MFLKELHYWTIITCSLLLLSLRYELSMLFCNIVEHHYPWFIIQLCWYQEIDNALHYQHQAMQYNRIEFVEEEIESDELTVKTYRLKVLAQFSLSSWPVIWMFTFGVQFTSVWKELTWSGLRSLCCLSQSAVNGWLGHSVQKLILHLNYSTKADVNTLQISSLSQAIYYLKLPALFDVKNLF